MKQIIVDNLATKYYITEDGQCYNSNTGKYLKGQISNSGYLNYNLTYGGIKRRLYAHRLVAIAYILNPNNLPEVNHKNANKLDNRVENLEWVSHSENSRYNTLIGNNKNVVPVYQFNKDKELVNSYFCIEDAAKDTGFSISIIKQEVQKPIKTLSCGFYWNNTSSTDFKIQNYENLGKAKQVGRYNKITRKLEKIYSSTGEAARDISGVHSHISECCRGKIKSYKGYIWRYIEE